MFYGAAAYILWGAFPLYWPLLEPAGAVELLAHRVAWAALTMALVVLAMRRAHVVRRLVTERRTLLPLSAAAVVISVNWGTYIWGVTNGRVVEASLGYFINPLVTVLMGVFILGERLRPTQWVALSIGGAAVAVLTWDYGRPPWVALVLACSFGTYGLAKKKANAPAIESLTVETLLVSPFALGYLLWLGNAGLNEVGRHGIEQLLLISTAGIVTGVPLVLFSAAATRVTMVALGLLQYLAPILQFALGVLWFHEAMPAERWIGFLLVWLALAIFTVESVRHRRRVLRRSAEACAT
jgi:chloramphenicol-sensitive protein RarD